MKRVVCAIADIKVGKRVRRERGDIEGLAANIAELGLLHPIGIRPDNRLIFGERRLLAAKQLGWTKIPATVFDLDAVVRGEYAENSFRKNFTMSEAVAVKRAMEPLERAAAKQRQGTRTDKHPGKLPTSSKGRAADKVAKATSMGRRTLEKAEAIVDAAKAEPKKFGKLLEAMDRTGQVNGIYKQLKVARQAAAIRNEPPPLPGRGPYRVIVADPAWQHVWRKDDPSHHGSSPYPEMSTAQICAVDVGSIAARDCILWLWTTNFHMRQAFEVLDAWGFRHPPPTMDELQQLAQCLKRGLHKAAFESLGAHFPHGVYRAPNGFPRGLFDKNYQGLWFWRNGVVRPGTFEWRAADCLEEPFFIDDRRKPFQDYPSMKQLRAVLVRWGYVWERK
jgi:MT-A70/ParB-like nuclease domain